MAEPLDAAQGWKDFYARWPDDLARRGVLVTNFGEQIVFTNFMVSEAMLLVERSAPDTMGARQVILPYGQIAGLKITDVVKPRAFVDMGFVGRSATR
jgi:hypothetical protein